MFEKHLVLDTCALLWLVTGSERLSGSVLAAIDRAACVFVSAISAWEISLKYEQKLLMLPMEPEEWFTAAIEKHSLILVPLDVGILCSANKLPPNHRDPADRFIIATAVSLNAGIVTADEMFGKYDVRVLF